MLLDLDRQALQALIQQYGYDFQYIKPQSQVFKVKHSQNDIFYWKDNQMTIKGRRRIYYEVQYQQKQIEAISTIITQMPKNGVFMKLSQQLILKHLHVQNFQIGATLQRLRNLQEFYYSPITQLKPKTIQNLKKGFVYTYGYSKNYQPILILRVDRVNSQMQIQEIFNTLFYLMLIVCGFKMEPYFSQKYIIIIDLNNINMGQIPYSKMYSCLNKLALYSCGFTDQNFVLNAGEIWLVWACVKKILPDYAIKKIKFLDDKSQLLNHIDPEQLQQRYGGSKPDILEGDYWPPIASNKCLKVNDKNSSNFEETDFYSVCNDQALFTGGSVELTTNTVSQSGCCSNCQIM